MQQQLVSDHTASFSGGESDEWSQLILESAPTGILISDTEGRIFLANKMARELFGYSEEEFTQIKIRDLVPECARDVHEKHRADYHSKPETKPMGAGRDLCAVKKDGTEFPIEIGLVPLNYSGRNLVFSSIVDITERKKQEQELRNLSERLQFQSNVLNYVHDAVFFVDEGGIIREWNEGAKRIFGHGSDEAIGQPFSLITNKEDGALFSKMRQAIDRDKAAEEIVRCSHSSGRDIFIRTRATLISKGGITGLVFCARDITRRKELEAELLNVEDELQRKIGQDIHDDLCSQLSGIGCLAKVLENQMADNHHQEADMMKSICEMVSSAGTTARQIAHGLVPSKLEKQGLTDALSELVSENRKSYGIDIQLSLDDKKVIDGIAKETSVQLFRIAQEAISNATRHSDSETITISVSVVDHQIELRIADDGKGMSEDLVSLGVGLDTMRQRAELILAEFDVHAAPGKGTTVQCSVPLSVA